MGKRVQVKIGGRMLIVVIVGDILGTGIYGLVGKLSGQVGGMVWLPLATQPKRTVSRRPC